MTLQTSGAIYMSQIHAEFGRGYDLNAYRNTQWWKDDGSTGLFSWAITFYEFYGKRAQPPPYVPPVDPGPPPVTPGAQEFYSNGTFYIPRYNSLTIRCDGGKGSDTNGFIYCGGGVYYGGNGGLAIKTWGPGHQVGAGTSVTVGAYANASAMGVTGFRGGDASPGAGFGGGGDCGGGLCTQAPGNGGPGGASGGDTNIVGGSAVGGGGRVRFDWS